MAMLAERKRKQKWSLNPRGNHWSEDTNKFGQKMLEKMGWKSGKGLGANEDGMTDHVKVSYKNDSKGMGFKESDNQWTEHDSNFQSLLENLNTEAPAIETPETGTKSLEEKSSKSRARVHYHKFTRGKDLSRYSEKDLANIFGKKTLNAKKSKEIKPEETKEEPNESTDSKEYGVQTIKGGSMTDYFKKKLPSFGMFHNGFTVGKNGVLKKADTNDSNGCESEDERPSFGLGFASSNDSSKNENFAFDYKAGFSTFVKSETSEVNDENSKESKKKRKLSESTEETIASISKKIKIEATEAVPLENKFEVKRKDKKSKKKKLENSAENLEVDNPNFDDSVPETPVVLDNIYEVKRKDKKGKKKLNNSTDTNDSNKEIDNPNFEANDQEPAENTEENIYEVKRKDKKKKKNKSENVEVDNPNFNLNDSQESTEQVADNPFEVKRKEKKLKKKKNRSEEVNNVEIPCEGTPINKKVKLEAVLTLTPILKGSNKADTPLSAQNTPNRRKSVRFSEINQQRLIPPIGFEDVMSLEEFQKCNELFDINTQVIKSSLEDHVGENQEYNAGFVNTAFDMKSIDQMSFYMKSFEKELPEKVKNKHVRMSQDEAVKENLTTCFVNPAFNAISVDKTSFYEKEFENSPTKKKKKKKKNKKDNGLANEVYNEQNNELEENVVSIEKELENYQAEVENDINEKKHKS